VPVEFNSEGYCTSSIRFSTRYYLAYMSSYARGGEPRELINIRDQLERLGLVGRPFTRVSLGKIGFFFGNVHEDKDTQFHNGNPYNRPAGGHCPSSCPNHITQIVWVSHVSEVSLRIKFSFILGTPLPAHPHYFRPGVEKSTKYNENACKEVYGADWVVVLARGYDHVL